MTPHPIRFYGDNQPYGFLSNFYAAPITLAGATWPTTEHYYQAQKSSDAQIQAAIRQAETPDKAKRLGRTVTPLPGDWTAHRDEVMLAALCAKFTQHTDLAAMLLATGQASLVEHTTNDRYWGDGGDGSGRNRLGELLMQVRAEVAAASPSVNRAIIDWLFASDRLDLRRSVFLDSQPPAYAAPIPWSRVEGMLLGLAIGDALGNTSEAQFPGARRQQHPADIRDFLPNRHAANQSVGLPSDDSQMAFWLLDQINQDDGLTPEHLAQRFCTERIFGIGSTVRAFIHAFKDEGKPWYASGQPSAGNGALMRIAPVLIPYLHRPSPALWIDTLLAASLTHNDSASTAACVAFVAMLWELLGRAAPPDPAWWVERYAAIAAPLESGKKYTPRAPGFADWEGSLSEFVAQHVPAAAAQKLSTLDACNGWYSGAYLLETLSSALYILTRYAHDPEEAIVRAVNDTWDNDTTAAIVGAAVGALHGVDALPLRWRAGLLGRLGADDDGRLFDLLTETRNKWGFAAEA